MIWSYLLIYFISEILGHLIFYFLRKKYLGKSNSYRPMIHGIIERLFLHISLLAGYPQSLVLFGALKIGTRIKAEENKISNDYFLLGNLISVGLVLLAISIWQYIHQV